MPTNKNLLREDAFEFALNVANICEVISDSTFYVELMLASSSAIGTCLAALKNTRDEDVILRRLSQALDLCTEFSFALKILRSQNKLNEDTYKMLKKQISSIERRITTVISE